MKKRPIKLSDHFDYRRLLRFTAPSIVMMIFTSIYGVVDGLFVSNFAGKTAFAAVNFIMPVLMIGGAFGFMFGTGGCALVSKTLGEGDHERANRLFSLIIAVSSAAGILVSAVMFVFARPIAAALGAEGEMLDQCVLYARINLVGLTAFMLQQEFQSFFIAAERPKLGLWTTVAAGVTNMILDALFVGLLGFGVAGAAFATILSQCVGGVIPLFYFLLPNTSLLRLVRPRWDGGALLRCITNGSSELMSNISMSLVGMLYNVELIRYAGENGVAAYGVLMYVNLCFLALFIGYVIGAGPVVSFHHGAQNHAELKSLVRKSLVLIGAFSFCMLVLCEVLAVPLSDLFAGYDAALHDMTVRGFRIFAFSFLFAGLAIFGSSFFTALNNGLISALISFLRTLIFQTAAVIVFPLIWGIDGIWASIVGAEVMAALTAMIFLAVFRKKYRY